MLPGPQTNSLFHSPTLVRQPSACYDGRGQGNSVKGCVSQIVSSVASGLFEHAIEPADVAAPVTTPSASPFCTLGLDAAALGIELPAKPVLSVDVSAAKLQQDPCPSQGLGFGSQRLDCSEFAQQPLHPDGSTQDVCSSLAAFSLSVLPTMASVFPGTQCQPCPPHGVKAVCGKRAKMEDTFMVQTNFFDLPVSQADEFLGNKLPARIAPQLHEALEQVSPTSSMPLSPSSNGNSLCNDQEHSVGCSSSASSDTSSTADSLHFFAVYDGHGGIEAAQHCANRLHHHLSEYLASCSLQHEHTVCAPTAHGSGLQCQAEWTLSADEVQEEDLTIGHAQPALSSPCQAHDAEAIHHVKPLNKGTCSSQDSETEGVMFNDSASSGSDSSARSEGSGFTSLLEEALREAFLRTDAEFAADGTSSMVGSTAVVAVLGRKRMWIANCGDSRAVLCRNGKAIQLTDDHKPEREDEAERVEKAGGQVLFWNGHRVMGVLAMSRAIGDHGLRPYVIPEPEITVVSRAEEDDILLLASDGLWDVMSNQEACNLAVRCMAKAAEKGASRRAAVRIAASVVTKAAVDRGSKDNVTVVIIDMKSAKPTASEPVTSAECRAAESMGVSPCPCPCASALMQQDTLVQSAGECC